MSLQAVYERFLANPTPASLSRDVSLNYITTTTSISGADDVLNHLQRQSKVVKKKADKTLGAIESPDFLVLDVETTLEFVSGGGAYLPSLDDNFLADRVVTFPMVHIVRFDTQNQIQQIRIYWDQGSLLKQVDVIGSRGRNWPIRDAKDQSKLIANVISAQGTLTTVQRSVQEPAQNVPRAASPSKKHIKDPHASLSLFGGNAEDESPLPAVVAPYARVSSKPAPRDPTEILGGAFDDEATPTKSRESIISPKAGAAKHFGPIRVFGDDSEESIGSPVQPRLGSSRNFQPIRVFASEDGEQTSEAHVQPRAGSSKNFQPVRLFGDEATAATEEERRYKTHPKKFSHFEMGDQNDGSQEIQERPAAKTRPTSQWDFSDFATPEKPRGKLRAQDVRHFGWSDNEDEVGETPPARPRVIQPRRDAETHFDLGTEESQAGAEPSKRIIGSAHNKGLGLYENNLYGEDGNPAPPETSDKQQPLGVVANNAFRKKDFDSHWEISDASPSDEQVKAENRPISSDHIKAVKMMDSQWDTYDQSPEPKKEDAPKPAASNRVSRAFQPSWGFGDE